MQGEAIDWLTEAEAHHIQQEMVNKTFVIPQHSKKLNVLSLQLLSCFNFLLEACLQLQVLLVQSMQLSDRCTVVTWGVRITPGLKAILNA